MKERPWACERCSAEYDRAAIENLMIDSLLRRLASYQLQDLRCLTCKQIKSDNMRVTCECSGEYGLDGGAGGGAKGEMSRRLAITAKVADYHNLDVLGQMVEWMRGSI